MLGDGSLQGHRAGLGVRVVQWLLFLTFHAGLIAEVLPKQKLIAEIPLNNA